MVFSSAVGQVKDMESLPVKGRHSTTMPTQPTICGIVWFCYLYAGLSILPCFVHFFASSSLLEKTQTMNMTVI